MTQSASETPTILTVGHSNRTLDDFLELLRAHQVELIVDVRKLPGSRRYPHFNAEALQESLAAAGIGYLHLPGLGGRRKGAADSPNGAWQNPSFRAYADYMQTAEFTEQLEDLIARAQQARAALMCSEAVPWRCHRNLIADALVVRGVPVEHIMTPTKRDRHALRDWAQVEGTTITYPPPLDPQGKLFEE